MSEYTTIIQFIVSPLLVAALAGIGWITRNYLRAIRHQVENDHTTNLRNDIDDIKDALRLKPVVAQDDIDRVLDCLEKQRMSNVKVHAAVERIEAVLAGSNDRLTRIETRLDTHIEKH